MYLRAGKQEREGSQDDQTDKEHLKEQITVQFSPPLSSACHAHGGVPCPSAGQERYVRPRGVEARLVSQEREELEGSEWAEKSLEVLEPGVTVALDDCAPLCHRRHGYDTEIGTTVRHIMVA
ncbi:hypothetical protein XENOCAPTIV_026936 [Xenoophorus captivus]|uniref:Uncharacterized protein n=1 Tax=Xenoophorus captivus TaxID=1517983 RepID=A0ABV0RFA0_9TELE